MSTARELRRIGGHPCIAGPIAGLCGRRYTFSSDDPPAIGAVDAMKIPLSWLRDYVAFDVPPGELARRLTLYKLRARVGSRGMQRMKWAPDNKRFI